MATRREGKEGGRGISRNCRFLLGLVYEECPGVVLFVRSRKYVRPYSPSTNPILKQKREERGSVEGWFNARSIHGKDGFDSCYSAIEASLTIFAKEEELKGVSGFTHTITR